MSTPSVRRAHAADADTVSELFRAYCAFYKSDVDVDAAEAFVRERLQREEAVIFLAERARVPAGFTLLYPKFSSTRLRRDWILNDLFVSPDHRRQSVAQSLLRAATAFVERSGARVVALKTQIQNTPARALYEREGWQLDTEFLTYVFDVEQQAASNAGTR